MSNWPCSCRDSDRCFADGNALSPRIYCSRKRLEERRAQAARDPKIAVPELRPGYRRQWVRCRECQRVAFYDYIPYSLSNPVMTLPCGHGLTIPFRDAVHYLAVPEYVKIIRISRVALRP